MFFSAITYCIHRIVICYGLQLFLYINYCIFAFIRCKWHKLFSVTIFMFWNLCIHVSECAFIRLVIHRIVLDLKQSIKVLSPPSASSSHITIDLLGMFRLMVSYTNTSYLHLQDDHCACHIRFIIIKCLFWFHNSTALT